MSILLSWVQKLQYCSMKNWLAQWKKSTVITENCMPDLLKAIPELSSNQSPAER